MKTNQDRLDRVTTTIVHELGEVGIFQYNKLAYLFEYFYIKNFGRKYTGEDFVKQKHGPVITTYKKQIKRLQAKGWVSVDIDALTQDRRVDDYHFPKIKITKAGVTQSALVEDKGVHGFLMSVLTKFGKLDAQELERFVYQTRPLVNYERLQMSGRKRTIGGYILDNCITQKEFDSPRAQGRRLALEHLNKYKDPDFAQQEKDAEEFSFMEKMRPEW